ncbi:restriction endonuclease subunit S [Bordetella bronchiseptica]|uniref:restriction endonuclease subunit S n=1 Tax=Bordetella bronchiseptica TaxID=518 RepID=UPI0004A04929|nr:restriction endonuclease subunit S [Bordetella bronchiseptica]KDC80354.1 hypothetical protein L513_0916 [Bordetella bronchiseptica MBORD632]
MVFKTTPLGELMGDKGYIRGPFGSALKRAELKKVGMPVYEQQHAIEGIRTFRYFIDDDKYSELRRFAVEANDLIISCSGTVGRISVIQAEDPKGIISQALLILRPDINKILPYYLYYFLTSKAGAQELVNASHGAVQLNIAPRNIVEKIPVPLPANAEIQRRIIRQLKVIDDKIALNRRINQTLEAMAQAIFRSWFVDFDPVKAKIAAIEQGQDPLRAAMRAISGKTDAELDQMPREHHDQLAAIAALFPDAMEESELGEIPKGWKAGTLAEICHLNPESWNAKTLPNTVSYVDLANTKSGEISELQVVSEKDIPSRARRILRPGDTIIGTVRPGNRSFALVGKENLTGSTGFAVLRPIAQEWLEFVYLVATSGSNIDRLTHLADGGAYPAVRPEVVVQGNIVIPDRMLAQKFHQYVQPFWVNILANRESAENLAELRDVLLPELLSGNIYIQHEEDR